MKGIDIKLNAIVKEMRGYLENLEIQTDANLRESERVIKDNIRLQDELHAHIKEADFRFKERAAKLEEEIAKQHLLTGEMESERNRITNIAKEQEAKLKIIKDNLENIEANNLKSNTDASSKKKLAEILKEKISECEQKMDSTEKLRLQYEDKMKKCDALEKDLIRQRDEAGRKANDLDCRDANLKLQEKEVQRERQRLRLG